MYSAGPLGDRVTAAVAVNRGLAPNTDVQIYRECVSYVYVCSAELRRSNGAGEGLSFLSGTASDSSRGTDWP